MSPTLTIAIPVVEQPARQLRAVPAPPKTALTARPLRPEYREQGWPETTHHDNAA